jgi:hypothetical protein
MAVYTSGALTEGGAHREAEGNVNMY